MKLQLSAISARPFTGSMANMVDGYIQRTAPYFPLTAAHHRTEAAFLDAFSRIKLRTAPIAILLDPRGRTLSSDQLAALLHTHRQTATQLLIFAVGPADGWSAPALERATMLLSLGPMTLPHELARLILAEQLYRAATILAGHPYHAGH